MILISSILFSKRCAKIGKVDSLVPIYKVKNVESVTDKAPVFLHRSRQQGKNKGAVRDFTSPAAPSTKLN